MRVGVGWSPRTEGIKGSDRWEERERKRERREDLVGAVGVTDHRQ